MLACGAVAAAAVAVDVYFSAQEGYLSRPPDYDGVSYMGSAQTVYHLVLSHHFSTALHALNNSIAPLWIATLAFQQLILGDGTWQAFTARFWAVAPLLVLIYWIVRARAPRAVAIAAVGLTALLPLVSAGVRSSSWEFLSGQANYNDDWGLADLRPDFFAIVLVLWSVALLAEHAGAVHLPSRPALKGGPPSPRGGEVKNRHSAYLVSAAFAAAAVLMKPSTAPIALVAWGAALAVTWYWNRRTPGVVRMTATAVGFLVLVLLPWATLGHGVATMANYFYAGAVTFRANYAMSLGFVDSATYYLVRIPSQLGQVEAWPAILGSLYLAVALVRRKLGGAEWIYAGLVVLFYGVFTAPAGKNPHVGEWVSLALWIFFLAGASRALSHRSLSLAFSPAGRGERLLAAVGVWALIVYALGAFALFYWPSNEQRANAQLAAVTADLANELGRHVSVGQCFTYTPGPGWPGSLELLMTNSDGAAPQSTPIDVDPTLTTSDYIATASTCPAVVVYRENITQVAQAFFCPPVRQPYLQALSGWVRGPGSGYALDRTWQFTDLPPAGPHTLGRYQGVSLTVELYLRVSG